MSDDPAQKSTQAKPRLELLDAVRIVLVEPSHPGNIGAAARALKTMGLSNLVIVAPKRFPDPQAQWRAAGAQDTLDGARVVATLDEAIDDCSTVIGTSNRLRNIPWPVAPATEAVASALAAAAHGPVAILFGREDNGLTGDELRRCHLHLAIPANPDYSSLNLAMAVQIVCYELFRQAAAGEGFDNSWDRPAASSSEVDGMLGHLEQALTAVDFHDPSNPGQSLTRLRRLFLRIRPDVTEVAMLRGVLTSMQHAAAGRLPSQRRQATAPHDTEEEA